ncbi:NAD(P)-dependent oxidoreductase [Propylenella binzhouense]|uniref:NAD(P)-dependent oxidoreductase n=1 Tax=Propylenella binzhouense TaxID=2555902 RepID=A0A964T604_9HYPH|nr:NAD(P)-dependent oxidoreductase [Propylenella binzhouense]MYZ49065.1 NAD(P)-dependent oxidoreductase [Propylenella binzhouense]
MAQIGFLGTGIMGFQMARRLCEAGHRVSAWNRTRDKAERLLPFGGTVADEPRAAADGAEIVIGMLADGPTSEAVFFGQGVVAAMGQGALLVDMASIPVETAQEHARRCRAAGIGYLDAPVSGGEKGATDGTLAIMAGGESGDFERAKPVLAVLGRPALVGPAGSGDLAKLCNQMIVGNTIATVAEALLLAERGGADPAAVREALMGGFADSAILRNHGLRMIERNFRPGGLSRYQLKDMRTASAHARSKGLELPVTECVSGLFAQVVEHGDAELDHSALMRELRRRNGLPVE